MPEIAKCTANGAATGLFPIGLVIVSALFTYGITVESGEIGEIKVNFVREYTRFEDRPLDEPEHPEGFQTSEPPPEPGAFVENPLL